MEWKEKDKKSTKKKKNLLLFLSTPSGLPNSSLLLYPIMCSAIEFISLIKELL